MAAPIPFEEHRAEWTPEKSGRFWDFQSRRPGVSELYFSAQVGDAVIDLTERHIRLRGRRMLDFGCGPGFLSEKLARRGLTTRAVDFSKDSVEATRQRAGGLPSFLGADVLDRLPTPHPDASSDVIFVLETLEHLFPEQLEATGIELARLTARGGHVVITVPNEENLSAQENMCPDCGCVFHAVQHLSSWNADKMSAFLSVNGFAPVFVKAVALWPYPGGRLVNLATTLLRRKKHNLLAIGCRQ